jgi:leucyl aminopeptidase
VDEQVTLAEETIFARNLGNERANVVDPAFMESIARLTAGLPNMSVQVLQEEDLKKEGMEMFLSVGQAATCPPRLVILEYNGNPDSEDKIALVGKGICFDTGGLNLKPTGFIEDMHTDMCGSAAVLGATRAASRLGLKTNIVCALALAENAIGPKAVKPHTIMKSYKVVLGLTKVHVVSSIDIFTARESLLKTIIPMQKDVWFLGIPCPIYKRILIQRR